MRRPHHQLKGFLLGSIFGWFAQFVNYGNVHPSMFNLKDARLLRVGRLATLSNSLCTTSGLMHFVGIRVNGQPAHGPSASQSDHSGIDTQQAEHAGQPPASTNAGLASSALCTVISAEDYLNHGDSLEVLPDAAVRKLGLHDVGQVHLPVVSRCWIGQPNTHHQLIELVLQIPAANLRLVDVFFQGLSDEAVLSKPVVEQVISKSLALACNSHSESLLYLAITDND